MYNSMDLEINLTIKENLTIMLVASSALSVCTETMDHSTGTEPKLSKFSLFDFIFHMF